MADDFDTLVAALRRWTKDHDPHVRAAVELLIWHEYWLRRADFRKAAVGVSGDEAWIYWARAREYCDDSLRASTSEHAILDLAVALGENRFKLSIMGSAHSRAIADAVRQAVGL